jgi:hypothetical protein
MNNDFVEIEYPEPEYALFETSREELPAIVVVNAALQSFPHPDVFAWHLSILISANEMAEQGMPISAESEVIGAVGDEIEAAVLADSNALFLARETWNGTRQLVYLVHDPDTANEALQVLIAQPAPKREWDFRMDHDPSWSLAEPYLALFESAL